MKILVLGATGRTGKWLLKYALEKGHEVVCLVRNADFMESKPNLKIIRGNPANYIDLNRAIEGCDAVINVLNISRKSDSPWSRIISPVLLLSMVMTRLIHVMNQNGIKRITVCSAWGVGETATKIPVWLKWLIVNSNLSFIYLDHERVDHLIKASYLDWTIVRPVILSNSERREIITESFNGYPKPGLRISRQSLSKFLLESVTRDDLVKQIVVISSK